MRKNTRKIALAAEGCSRIIVNLKNKQTLSLLIWEALFLTAPIWSVSLILKSTIVAGLIGSQ